MADPATCLAAAACAAAALAAMARVAWVDLRRFEIEPGSLAAAAGLALAAAVLAEGRDAVAEGLALGALGGGAAALVARLRPGAVGRGDIGLVAALGPAAGLDLMPVLLVLCMVCAAATGAAFAAARGKRLFGSMIPAGLPAMSAAAPVLAWRVEAGLSGRGVQAGLLGIPAHPAAVAACLAAALLLTGAGLALSRAASRRARKPDGRSDHPESTRAKGTDP